MLAHLASAPRRDAHIPTTYLPLETTLNPTPHPLRSDPSTPTDTLLALEVNHRTRRPNRTLCSPATQRDDHDKGHRTPPPHGCQYPYSEAPPHSPQPKPRGHHCRWRAETPSAVLAGWARQGQGAVKSGR